MRAMIGAEKSLGAAEQAVIVLVPADAFAGSERFGNHGRIAHAGLDYLEKSRQEDGAIFIGLVMA